MSARSRAICRPEKMGIHQQAVGFFKDRPMQWLESTQWFMITLEGTSITGQKTDISCDV